MTDLCTEHAVYKLGFEDGARWLVPADDATIELLRAIECREYANAPSLRPISARYDHEKHTTPAPSDFVYLMGGHCAVTDIAKQRLASYLHKWFLLIPLQTDDQAMWLCCAKHVLDALLLPECEGLRVPPHDEFLFITHHVFAWSRVCADCFLNSHYGSNQLYVTARFVDTIKKAELSGLTFTKVWSESQGPIPLSLVDLPPSNESS